MGLDPRRNGKAVRGSERNCIDEKGKGIELWGAEMTGKGKAMKSFELMRNGKEEIRRAMKRKSVDWI